MDDVDLQQSACVSREWWLTLADEANGFWQRRFRRDYCLDPRCWSPQKPQELTSWKYYYYYHRYSRALELAQTHPKDWVVIQGRVYDVSNFIDVHPGGHQVILDCVGKDATTVWEQFDHSTAAQRLMVRYQVEDSVLEQLHARTIRGNLVRVQHHWLRQQSSSEDYSTQLLMMLNNLF